MAQGLLSGIALGAVFSLGVAGVVSVMVPLQPQPAPQLGVAAPVAPPQASAPQTTAIITREGAGRPEQPTLSLRTPEGAELPKEPAAAALAPETTSDVTVTVQNTTLAAEPVTPPQSERVASALKPAPLPPVGAGASDATPVVPSALPQPQTGAASDLTQPRPVPQGVAARAVEDSAVLPNPQALAPMIPDDSQDKEITSQTGPDVAVPAADADQKAAALQGDETFIVVEPETGTSPATSSGAGTQEAAPVTTTASKPRVLPVPGTQIGTLGSEPPQSIGTPANTLISRTPLPEATPVETPDNLTPDNQTPEPQMPVSQTPDTRAISRFAQPFENAEGKPLMSIVLIDSGADLVADEIGLPALSSFPYPVSFAVDANLSDAAARVARYRAEGFDVLALIDLPKGAQPTDAEVSLNVALNGLPEIVGVLEGTGEGLQGSRQVADQVTRILQASGHGLVAQSKGLDSMPKLALKQGVPAAPVFRDFDSQGQKPRVIRRFLDQAAFKAGQEGGVIMLGRLRPETIEALLVWGLADRAGSVALAPVSAVLLAQR